MTDYGPPAGTHAVHLPQSALVPGTHEVLCTCGAPATVTVSVARRPGFDGVSVRINETTCRRASSSPPQMSALEHASVVAVRDKDLLARLAN